jgi:chemotaxis signal transduction protein
MSYTGTTTVLLMRVADVDCAIPIAHVIKTMRGRPVTPLDGLASGVLGAAIIRGERTPVIDLGALLGVARR